MRSSFSDRALLSLGIAALLLIGSPGCASIKPDMHYTSNLGVSKADVAVIVEVSIQHEVQVALVNEGYELSALTSTVDDFRAALEADLDANGPYRVDRTSPDARLKVNITRIDVTPPSLNGHFAWFLLGVPLLGIPIERTEIEMVAMAQLVDGNDKMITQASAEVQDRTYTGVYYGHNVTFGSAGQQLAEALREKLAKQNRLAEVALKNATPVQLAGDNRRTSPTPSNAGGGGAPSDLTTLQGAPQPTAYALVIGVESYRDIPPATGAKRDVEDITKTLQETFNVPKSNIRIALNDRATKGDIQKQLEWLEETVPVGGRVYFFFSGHGAPDVETGEAYVLPYDADAQRVRTSGMPLNTVLASLSETRAREIFVFVDSCFSGSGGRSVLPEGVRPLVPVMKPTQPQRIAMFTSASGSQISGAVVEGEGGLFTHHVTRGIASGRADLNGDGQISLQELSEWVSPRVSREALEADRTQTPELRAGASMDGPDDLILVWGLPQQ